MTDAVVFSGVLGRIAANGHAAILHFYPFVFNLEADAKPVLVIACTQPAFSVEDLVTTLQDTECDVEISGNAICLYSYFIGEERTLEAKAISCSWQRYDIQDYRDQVAQLTKLARRTDKLFRQAETRNRNALALIEELSRRAELKALASKDSKMSHEATVKALAWVKTRLEKEDQSE